MNAQNFDKIFGDKLNEGLDFNFTEQKWSKMEKHMDAFHTEKWRKRLFGWLILPLLALIGVLTWGGWLLHDAQKHISALMKEVHDLRLEKQVSSPPSVLSTKNGLKSDTVYQHIVVRRYDTIFQTVVRRELAETVISKDNFSTIEQNSDNQKHIDRDVQKSIAVENQVINARLITTKEDTVKALSQQKTDIIAEKKNNIPSISDAHNNAQKDGINTDIPLISKVDEPIKTDGLITSPPLSKNEAKAIQKAKTEDKNEEKVGESIENTDKSLENQKRVPIIKPIKIAGYELGILGGIASLPRPNIVRQNGFSVVAKGSILLGDRWKIVGETQYLFLSYETDKITTDLDIKIITPPTPNDSLDGVKVKQPYLQYAIGMQYVLSEKRLKPYIGINLLGQSKLQEEFEYEYINTLTNTPVFVQTIRKEKSFQLPFMRLQLGASYPIFGKVNAQIEGSYDVKLGNNTQFKPLWQVKTGLLYRF
jgi:hypothetical protein